jgi:peroxiredoxin
VNGKLLAPFCLLVLLVVPGLTAAQPKDSDPFKALELIRPSRVQPAKEFTAPTPDGKSLRLSDSKGKVVFLNFWATWCPPCREEMPAMERLYQRYKDKGLVVLALSIDVEGAPVVIPFVKEHNFSFPVGLDPKMTVADKYGVRALPSTFLVDRKGNLAAMAIGPRQWDGKSAHALIELLLK